MTEKLEAGKKSKKAPKAVGSQATPEVIQTWVEVYQLFQACRGERKDCLQQVADKLGLTYKVARRRLRNYEAMKKAGRK
ncbi:MAG: hypothetical protein WBP93_18295 [Pyrinomonadaceae bacterium]